MPLDLSPYSNKSNAVDLTQFKSGPIDLTSVPEPVPKPTLTERAIGALKTGAEVGGTLALSGVAWGAGLIAKAAPYTLKSKPKDIDERIKSGEVLVGPGAIITPEDIAQKEQIRQKRKQLSEEIQTIPSLGLPEKSQQIVQKISYPFEKVGVARSFYQDMATKKWGEATGDLIGDAFEVTVYLGLPKLGGKLTGEIRAGKLEAARETIREIHRQQLKELINEPNRLEHLAKVERNLSKERELPARFNTSFEADEFGNSLGKDGASRLRERSAEYYKKAKELENKKDKTLEEFNLQSEYATQGQYFREAAETADGTAPTKFREGFKKRDQSFGKLKQDIESEIAVTEQAKKEVPEGGTTLSMLGTQNAYDFLVKNKQWLTALHDAIDVEAPWQRMGAAETGFAFKNIMSRRSVMEEVGVKEVAKNAKLFNYDPNLAPDVVLAAENPKLITPEIKPAVDHLLDFQETIRKEYQSRGVKLDFHERIRNEISELIDATQDTKEITELRGLLKQVNKVKFVHIPSAFWFENMIGKDPAGSMRLLKIVASQKRKTFMIKGLIDRGILKREQIHPGDVIASYARRAGKDFALLDLRDAAVKDKLAYHGRNKNAPEGFVDAPRRAYIFKNYKLHPALADALSSMLDFSESRGKFDQFSSLTKMTAFYNPLFLPMYDTVQAGMLGAVTHKFPFHLAKAIKDLRTMSPNYIEALNNGLASKPFSNPLNSYIDMVEWAKRSPKQKFVRIIESVYPKNWLKSVYTPSWVTSWKMDEAIRMTSYNYLRSKGFNPREAAQTAAVFHSDYASVPANTRRMLNKVFFTPTFKITMGKLYARMMKEAIKSAVKLGRNTKVGNRFAKGALITTGMMVGFDQLMTRSLGFKRDEFGRRYVKDVETEEGHKQVVFTFSTPFNMWQKYIYRTKAAFAPGVENKFERLLEMNRWEFHPLWRTAYDIKENDNGLGDKIYSEFDDDVVKFAKIAKYSFTNIVRIAGVLDQQPSNVEAQEQFAKETSRAFEYITRPFAFKYMRSNEDRRAAFKIKELSQRFQTEMNKRLRDKKGFNQQWLDNFQKQVDEILSERERKKK